MINYICEDTIVNMVRKVNEKEIKKEQIISCFKNRGLFYIVYEEKE